MRQLNSITSKTVRVKVNSGWTTERFLNEYGITQEEFDKKILEVFPTKRARSEVQRDLEQNDKRFERGKKNNIKRKKIVTPISPEIMARIESFGKEQKTETLTSETLEAPKSQIEILGEEIQKSQEEIKGFKEEKEKVRNVKENLLLQQANVETSIRAIKQELAIKEMELEDVITQIRNQEAELHRFDLRISKEEERVKKLEEDLSELKKIQIIFLDSGEIDVYPDEERNKLEYSWKECYDKLLNSKNSNELDEILDEMTLREIRQLAKAIALLEVIESKNLKYEFLIENERVEAAWQVYHREACDKCA